MILFPNAKVNIGLHILGKRNDGFHELQTIMAPVGWHDSLEIFEAKNDRFSIQVHGIKLDGGANICEACYELFQGEFDIPPVTIHLLKGIPAGAGLGGGSADAAFLARAINDKFDLGLSASQLEERVAKLGSDCPFFIKNTPQLATGRGEVLEEISLSPMLSGKSVVVVYPAIHISTADAYANCSPVNQPFDVGQLVNSPVEEWNNIVRNDFQPYAVKEHPAIGDILQMLNSSGADFTSLSGSGSAVFGIFEGEPPSITWPDNYSSWSGSL